MAPLSSTSRRPLNSRRKSARKSDSNVSSVESPSITETRSMKRKYVPGGPGGGGRYVANHGNKVLVGGTGPGGYNYVGLRGRVGRENAANGIQPSEQPRPRRESRRERVPTRPRFSSAAAAAAAVVHGDGFKPREERGWEEFHQDLDIGAPFPVFSADEVDGTKRRTPTLNVDNRNGSPYLGDAEGHASGERHDRSSVTPGGADTTPRRRPGRPPRRADSMLKGIGTPEVPKVVPLPGFNPREKLTLPKPSFRAMNPFHKYEQDSAEKINYVDKTMAHVGYQESEVFIRPEKNLIRVTEGNIEEDLDMATGGKAEGDSNSAIGYFGVGRVEYDMDEQDGYWLETHNVQRKTEGVEPIRPAIFEITMTKIEKEWHALEKRIPKPNPKPPQTHRPRSSSAAAVNGEIAGVGEEQDSKCAICDDGDCENTNAIVFCDGCDLAVHQECYGVPFIPEGQWLCRKCQLVGRGTPTCIFCPNMDGAFKQTNASRWAHLLCAIWIPEVSIGNSTFMEPVMDVEKVPKARWKLTCYICRMQMGACIQCGNKNCYIAFHVTCARRARLFLKMKSAHGGPASIDASVLKAYCDKHVPAEWRREHDVDTATSNAMRHYNRTRKEVEWGDSQQSALMLGAPSQTYDVPVLEPVEAPNTKLTLTMGSNKRKRDEKPKIVWRLPSGAPVIPQAVYNSVESSLGRFTVRKRKEFAAEACKYWTLKREARRGAALLKRLQLQMETFTSMEITRRNFVGMGAAGGVRLQRRIDFAEQLLQDVDKLRQLSGMIKGRESKKLEDAKFLKNIVETVYFPIAPLLLPTLDKAMKLDSRGIFRDGFTQLEKNLSRRYYTSVAGFSQDLGVVFESAIEAYPLNDTLTADTDGEILTKDAQSDLKLKKALAKRIVKAVKEPLEDATRKESQLRQKSYEKELRDLDRLLENSISSRRDSTNGKYTSDGENGLSLQGPSLGVINTDDIFPDAANGRKDLDNDEDAPGDLDIDSTMMRMPDSASNIRKVNRQQPTPESMPSTNGANGNSHGALSIRGGVGSRRAANSVHASEPPTPPMSSGEGSQPFSQGGIPWYMQPFDPSGTTIEEERWTGRDLVRGMSEDLSDMDEEELSGLVDADEPDSTNGEQQAAEAKEKKRLAYNAKRRKKRGNR